MTLLLFSRQSAKRSFYCDRILYPQIKKRKHKQTVKWIYETKLMEVSQGDLRAKSRVFNFDVCLQLQDVDSTPIKKPRLTLSDRPLYSSFAELAVHGANLLYFITRQKKNPFQTCFFSIFKELLVFNYLILVLQQP